MAIIRYIGTAATVVQIDDFTPANPNTDDVYTLTATGANGRVEAVSFTVVATETVAAVCTGLAAAWNASTDALHTGVTAADNTTKVTLTADTAGAAFEVVASITDGGGGAAPTLTRSVDTANSGPSDWRSADNWSGGAVPGGAASQDVEITGATMLYGLDQSAIANTLSSLTIGQSRIGTNPADGCLPVYLEIKVSVITIGQHIGPGSPTELAPIQIDTGSTASAITVYNSGTNSVSTMPAIRIKANSASTTLLVYKGKVGAANIAGETATLSSVSVSYASNVSGDADVFLGDGLTVTTVKQTGGDLYQDCGCTTLNSSDGKLTTSGDGTIATVNISGGNATLNSTGTVTLINATGGITDCTKSAAARTITTVKVDPGAVFKHDPSVVTLTNGIQPYSSSGNVTYTAS